MGKGGKAAPVVEYESKSKSKSKSEPSAHSLIGEAAFDV